MNDGPLFSDPMDFGNAGETDLRARDLFIPRLPIIELGNNQKF